MVKNIKERQNRFKSIISLNEEKDIHLNSRQDDNVKVKENNIIATANEQTVTKKKNKRIPKLPP